MVDFLENKHTIMKKTFEVELMVDGKNLPLNNFVQETIGPISWLAFLNLLSGWSLRRR
jgi:hypothetical protein